VNGAIAVSTDPADVDLDVTHGYLTRSYWSPGISREDVAEAIRHSYPFTLLDGRAQIGFARVVTDRIRFAWLCDVFVLETHQGRSLGKTLVEGVLNDPRFARLRRWMLGTRDAHGLYRQYGFSELPEPARFMIKQLVVSPSPV
jgi:GNAT superfamily N-acetyltransferase